MSTVNALSEGETLGERRALVGAGAKRAFDIVVSVPLCVLAIPVVLALAIVLTVRHRASPFFVHDRIGQGGRLISIPKLRTLAPHTHPYADKTLTELETPSRLAELLRSMHVDELPQLFLVPIGRLSLVGPRPRMVSEALEHADPAYEALRTSVPQGCSGLWQVSGAQGRVSDHPEFDRFYIDQRTLRLDAWILWRTLRQALGAAGADISAIPAWTLRRPALALADAA